MTENNAAHQNYLATHRAVSEVLEANSVFVGGKTINAIVDAVLSKLRAEGVQAGDEREALAWYAEQVAGCRKMGADGDAARQALDKDGGERARAVLASAPVAGEQIIAWDVQDTGLGRRYTTYNPKVAEDLMNLGENVRPLVYASALPPANAAPQASALASEYTRGRADGFDAGYSAALEKAAAALEDHRRDGREWVPGSLWDTLSREAAARIRALKQPQADKDGEVERMLDGDDIPDFSPGNGNKAKRRAAALRLRDQESAALSATQESSK